MTPIDRHSPTAHNERTQSLPTTPKRPQTRDNVQGHTTSEEQRGLSPGFGGDLLPLGRFIPPTLPRTHRRLLHARSDLERHWMEPQPQRCSKRGLPRCFFATCVSQQLQTLGFAKHQASHVWTGSRKDSATSRKGDNKNARGISIGC